MDVQRKIDAVKSGFRPHLYFENLSASGGGISIEVVLDAGTSITGGGLKSTTDTEGVMLAIRTSTPSFWIHSSNKIKEIKPDLFMPLLNQVFIGFNVSRQVIGRGEPI